MNITNKLFRPIVLRNDEGHRQATWLELFMDLAFVISVPGLTAMLVEDHSTNGFILYCLIFLAVFWIWNQLTWYSILFDNNDVFYRVMYLGAILSALGLASSFKEVAHGNTIPFIASYVLLQLFLAAGWLRIYFAKLEFKAFALKYLIGQAAASTVWLLSLKFTIPQQYYVWGIAMVIHVVSPYLAFKTKTFDIPIHVGHVVERYCLFTIIVLAETLIAVTVGLGSSLGSEAYFTGLLAYIIIACIWWSYFNWDFDNIRKFGKVSNIFFFGYGHFVVFLAMATFGAATEIAIHAIDHGGHFTLLERLLIAIPASLYLISLSLLNIFAWNMPFDKKIFVRTITALLSLGFALTASHASPVVVMGGIALLMVSMVIYEQLYSEVSRVDVQ